LEAFQESNESLSGVINVLADSAYTGKPFAEAVEELISASVEIAKRSELHTFKVIPKRWQVRHHDHRVVFPIHQSKPHQE